MNDRVLKCAVVGLGRIGWQFHIPQILKNPGFELTAVVDPDPERLAEAQQKFGLQLVCRTCEEIPTGTVDLAVISSPTRFHCIQTLYFLEHGLDVFCDKPIALSLQESRYMVETARRLERKLMVYQPHRLSSECLGAKAILESGKLGSPYMFSRYSSNFCRRNDWQALYANGGGMLFNYGAHYIDQMFYLSKDSSERVKCELRRVLSLGDADDVVRALITGKSGILYDLNINMASALPLPALILYGTLGTAELQPDNSWKLRYCRAEELPPIAMQTGLSAKGRKYPSETLPWREEVMPEIPEDLTEYYRICYDYYARDSKPFVPPEQTLEVMRTLELCRDNAAENRVLNNQPIEGIIL